MQRYFAFSIASVFLRHHVRFTTTDAYINRHAGPTPSETEAMLQTLGKKSMEELMLSVLPNDVSRPPLHEVPALSELEAVTLMKSLGSRNKIMKSMIGQGYYECITPPVIIRHVLENPGWYSPCAPFQPELSQGRLESLLNFQTLIVELSSMELANASLLDQATSCAEAMLLCYNYHKRTRNTFFVSKDLFPACIQMIQSRAEPLNIRVVVGDLISINLDDGDLCGLLVQTPDAKGDLYDFTSLFASAREKGVLCCCSTDLLMCCCVKPPGEMGADIVVGSAQRLGLPLGFGGPHAAFFAIKEIYKRLLPGRLIGVSKDVNGDPAMCMALQSREPHLKRERAKSNVSTSQTLSANMAAFYAIYHGPVGLKQVASEVHQKAKILAVGLESIGHSIVNATFFDTITVGFNGITPTDFSTRCVEKGINVFLDYSKDAVCIAVDEATSEHHIVALLEAAGLNLPHLRALSQLAESREAIPSGLLRSTAFLPQTVFNAHKSEMELMRYIKRLQRKDYGHQNGIIPVGSSTTKLNPANSMRAISWREFNGIHPLVPEDQSRGYSALCLDFEQKLREITGMDVVSLQPNSGSQGEYCALRVIRAYHHSRQEGYRNICLIPQSTHGTHYASAVLCGMKTIEVPCSNKGEVDMVQLEALCQEHEKNLSCLIISFPNSYGIYDPQITSITRTVHKYGGQCFMDGANFNALLGYTAPGFIGGDVCQIDLHKSLSIPHGGGGPGVAPVAVRQHLAPFLPNTVVGQKVGGSQPFGQVSQAPFGSASLLTVPYSLLLMLGTCGLKTCTEYAVLSANYLKKRLEGHYPLCFLDPESYCAHEFIIDIRPIEASVGVEAKDVAKRLMDYGLHPPTVGFPVPGTLLIEPTECESKREIDRLADAFISIREEIRQIEKEKPFDPNNLLKNAPHTASCATADVWDKLYTRQKAVYPTKYQLADKYWPPVARVDENYGDRHLMCTCSPLEFY